MTYFKTSFATLQQLARSGRFEDVAGFLVLARHASGVPVAGLEPYKLSGAGVNSIHEKAGLSEETARGVVERLQREGVILPAAPELKTQFRHARWEIVQGDLDLSLPHAFVDPLKGSGATSALRRIKDATVHKQYAPALQDSSDNDLRLDALMLLLGIYRHTRMEDFGGLNPRCAFRKWDVKSQINKEIGVRWGAEPDEKSAANSYTAFMTECLQHTGAKKNGPPKQLAARFWNAWESVQSHGLIYEAVSLFDADPSSNENARLLFTLRVNDFHAGSITKTGDPSFLREVEEAGEGQLGYYTPSENERGEPEAMWVILPDARGALIGVWRLRFRAATPDVGTWIEKESVALGRVMTKLLANNRDDNRADVASARATQT